MERARVVALTALGLLAGVGAAWIMLTNDVRPAGTVDVALLLAVGWSFLASGLVAWRLRPENRIGRAMVATGLLRFGEAPFWSQDPVPFTLGHVVAYAYLAGIVFVLLAFPTGRLETSLRRGLFGAAAVVTGPLQIAWLLLGGHDPAGACIGCPVSVLEVTTAHDLASAIQVTQFGAGLIVGTLSAALLVQQWRSSSAPLRFVIAPVIWVGTATSAAVVAMSVNHSIGEPLGLAPDLVLDLAIALLAVAFLVGVGRSRLARLAVADLLAELARSPAPGELRIALARAVRDDTLEVAYWLPADERFVDASGKPIALPSDADSRAVTVVEREGRRIAALIHDPAVSDDESLVQGVAAAAALQLENERLQADLRAQLEEVRASRARIVEATQEERRRLERDLHDGTQQRLVSIAMTLGSAEAKLATNPEAHRLIGEARTSLSAALEELRELSQGIHPGILTERGLDEAVDELALRMHLPVEVDVRLTERLPTPVETAAYYVICEALTNVAKHAGARRARVRVARHDGRASIVISDDGRGGADTAGGSGLRGLRDRVEALGGRFALESPVGKGTVIRAEIPCA